MAASQQWAVTTLRSIKAVAVLLASTVGKLCGEVWHLEPPAVELTMLRVRVRATWFERPRQD